MVGTLEGIASTIYEIPDFVAVDKDAQIKSLVEGFLPQSKLLRERISGETTCEETAHNLVGRYGGLRALFPMWRGGKYWAQVEEEGLDKLLDLGVMGSFPTPKEESLGPGSVSRTVDLLFNLPIPPVIITLLYSAYMMIPVLLNSDNVFPIEFVKGFLVAGGVFGVGASLWKDLKINYIMKRARNLDKITEPYVQHTS